MINKEILLSKETREILNGDLFKLGVDGENLQENLVFKFNDEFVDGTARVEITMQDGTKSYIMTTKQNKTYILPIKSVITKTGLNKMQLVITQGTNDEEIPIFKSKEFSFIIYDSINAEIEPEPTYDEWIDVANAKLNELDNIDIDVEKVNHTATITITKKDGTEEVVNIYDGEQGVPGQNGTNGKDAKINGVNTLTITAGANITLNQEGNNLEISSTGGGSGGTSNYSDLSNKPKINNIELKGNKTTSDLGLFSGDYNDLSNKPTIPVVPTNVSAFNNDAGYLVSSDISGKLDTSKVKSSYSTTSGDVYDVSYINTTIGDIESLLSAI